MSQLPAPTPTSQCPLTTLSLAARYGGGGGWVVRITRAATTGLTGRPNVPAQRPGQRQQQRGAGGKMKRKVGGWRQQQSVAGQQTGSWRHGAASQSAHHGASHSFPSSVLAAAGASARKQSADRVYISCLVPCRARNCAASPAPRRQP